MYFSVFEHRVLYRESDALGVAVVLSLLFLLAARIRPSIHLSLCPCRMSAADLLLQNIEAGSAYQLDAFASAHESVDVWLRVLIDGGKGVPPQQVVLKVDDRVRVPVDLAIRAAVLLPRSQSSRHTRHDTARRREAGSRPWPAAQIGQNSDACCGGEH